MKAKPRSPIILAGTSTHPGPPRRSRRRHATTSLRADDESIWIAYQSTVRGGVPFTSSAAPTNTLIPSDDPMSLLNLPGILPAYEQTPTGGILLRPEQSIFAGGPAPEETSLVSMD